MALKVKAQEKLQKIGTHAGKYRNGDCYGTRSHIMHGHVANKRATSEVALSFTYNFTAVNFTTVTFRVQIYEKETIQTNILPENTKKPPRRWLFCLLHAHA